MKPELRENIEIVLVEPSQPGNIGASARAMHNMGFKNLGLVKPVDFKVSEAYKFAWNSQDILDQANVYQSVSDAVKDSNFVIAMSARKGKERGFFEPLHEYAKEVNEETKRGKVSILFGCESWGLTNDDLKYANRIVCIQTAGLYTSLNLAQAVLITVYELFSASASQNVSARPKAATGEEINNCFLHIEKILNLMGYQEKGDPNLPRNIIKLMRKASGRAILEPREVRMMRGLCSQVEKIINGHKSRNPETTSDII